MSTAIQSPETLRECERCHTEVPDDNLMLVLHPESYGVAGSPTTYELVCIACIVRENETDDLPF